MEYTNILQYTNEHARYDTNDSLGYTGMILYFAKKKKNIV